MRKGGLFRKSVIVLAISVCTSVMAAEPQWPDEERDKAVSIHADFLVVRYDSGCTVKQSYEDSGMMELAHSAGTMNILSPFYRGVEEDVTYWIDENQKNTFSMERINENNSFPPVSPEMLKQMERGDTLYVRVNPVGAAPRIQKFGLAGLSEAIKTAESEGCKPKTDQKSNALEVQLSRSGDGFVVHGRTELPDGMSMQLSAFDASGKSIGSSDIKTENGTYRSSVIRAQVGQVKKGTYTISLSSPFWGLQPESVAEKLDNGRSSPKEIREKSYGQYVVDYTVTRKLE